MVCLYRAVRMAVLEGRLHKLPGYVRAAWKVSGALQLVARPDRPELLYCHFCQKWVQTWPYTAPPVDESLVYCRKCRTLLSLPRRLPTAV